MRKTLQRVMKRGEKKRGKGVFTLTWHDGKRKKGKKRDSRRLM